jgi:hypothetical protein
MTMKETKTQLEEPSRRRNMADETSPWWATGRESPVFLDERGRRGLLVRALGLLGAAGSAGALALLVTGALAFVHISPLSGHGILAARPALGDQAARHRAASDRELHGSAARHELLTLGDRSELVASKQDLKTKRGRA